MENVDLEFGLVKVPGLGYFVRSRSTEGAWWLVNGKGCTCPATITDCHHVRSAYAWEKLHGPAPRPTAKPNISALVD